MGHSNQMREFQLTDEGIKLVDVYVGPGAVLTGAARVVQEARDQAQIVSDRQASERRQRELEQEQANLRGQAEAIAKRLAGIGFGTPDRQETGRRAIVGHSQGTTGTRPGEEG